MPESDSKPSRIGGFELLATLGKGAMGVVFKARQVSMDRIVALKVLPPHLAKDEAYVARFLREARSAAKLNHPNIVQGIDVGVAEGNYYFAMEFVDGTTVKEILKAKGRLDEKSALNVVGAVARALEHAHKHGIIHRDIKPDNIMVARDGAVKLADLGLARSTEKPDTMTIEGTALGTPYYMAPEQVRAETDIDTRADIYALGATLYHMVTGEFAFTGANAGAIMARHLADPVPSARDKHPDVSRATDELIQRMMAKDRGDRPANPTALLAEIRDALAGKVHLRRVPHRRPHPHPLPAGEGAQPGPLPPASSGPLPPGEGRVRGHERRATSQPKRKTTLVASVALLALLAIVGLALALRKGPRPPERSETVREGEQVPVKTLEETEKTRVVVADDGEAKRKAAELAEKGRLAKARRQGEELLRQADAAIAQRDFGTARATIKSVEALDLPELTAEAQKKLAEIASREKSAAEWAKWDAIKADAKKLIDAGKLDEAVKLLEGAKTLPLADIGDRIAEQMESIEAARRKAAAAVLAAYQAESEELWALFRKRDYPAADALLVEIVGGTSPSRDPRRGDTPPTIKEMLAADQGAAKLLKEFWGAVERGVMARKGKFVSIAGRGGNVEKVEGGQVTLKVGAKEFTAPLLGMDAAQAAAIADLKDDGHGNLVKALFLLAEGEKLDDASTLLAAAGNPPGLSVYKDHLAALTLGAAEVAARRAWAEIEAAAKPKPTKAEAQRFLALLDAFEKTHANTKHFASVRDELPDLRAQAQPAPKEPEWVSLFDGKTLKGWQPVKLPQARSGKAYVEDGRIVLDLVGGAGNELAWEGPFPTMNYELELDGTKVEGEFLYGVIFPIGATCCKLDLGQTGGLDMVDGKRNWENAATTRMLDRIEQGHPYRCRLRVTRSRIQAWLDDRKIIDLPTGGHKFSLFPAWVPVKAIALSTWNTKATFGNIRFRRVEGPDEERGEAPKAGEWQSLFDGKTLDGWRVAKEFPGRGKGGEVRVEDGAILLQRGPLYTGLSWTGEFATMGYELAFDAMRVSADEPCLCHVIYPFRDGYAALLLGGKGNSLELGAGKHPSKSMKFEPRRWYSIRLRVAETKLQLWIDDELTLEGEARASAPEFWGPWRPIKPLGFFTNLMTASVRNIRLRRIEPGAAEAPAPRGGKTRTVGGGGGGAFEDRVEGEGYLVGLKYSLGDWAGRRVVKSLQGAYETPRGRVWGEVCGQQRGGGMEVHAKSGYAVGGLVVRGGDRVDGFRVIFMRVRGGRLDPTDRYESEWIGGTGGGEATLGGSGLFIVGLHGRRGLDVDAIGLIEAGE